MRLSRVGRRPQAVLGALIVVQWLAVLAFALTVRHNGWLYFQGGDETWYYTTTWLLAHGHLPQAAIGYVWSIPFIPVAWIVGPNLLGALPVVILVQTLVLLPLALLCVYGIATRIGGRLLGYWAAALWVAAPFVAIPLFVARYHERYVEQFLPQALGLTFLGDFPSMVCLLAAAYLLVRALQTHARTDTVAAGLVAGLAVGIKPANALFLVAAGVTLAVTRSRRQALEYAVALAPAVVTLALWKFRGLGRVPLAAPEARVAAGTTVPPVGSVFHFLNIDWGRLGENFSGLREFFWSERLVQWLPLAGLVAVLRRWAPAAALLAVWLGAYVIIKGAAPAASVDTGSFFRLLMPAWPAFLLLSAAIPLAVPGQGVQRAVDRLRLPPGPPLRPRTVASGAAVFAAVPLLVVLVAQPLHSPQAVKSFTEGIYVPEAASFSTKAVPQKNGSVALTWLAQRSAAADVFYRVFRAPQQEGVECHPVPHGGSSNCFFDMTYVGVARTQHFVDHPPSGTYTYRIALAANWANDLSVGDSLLLSTPTSAEATGSGKPQPPPPLRTTNLELTAKLVPTNGAATPTAHFTAILDPHNRLIWRTTLDGLGVAVHEDIRLNGVYQQAVGASLCGPCAPVDGGVTTVTDAVVNAIRERLGFIRIDTSSIPLEGTIASRITRRTDLPPEPTTPAGGALRLLATPTPVTGALSPSAHFTATVDADNHLTWRLTLAGAAKATRAFLQLNDPFGGAVVAVLCEPCSGDSRGESALLRGHVAALKAGYGNVEVDLGNVVMHGHAVSTG
jgi:hypothetical protein